MPGAIAEPPFTTDVTERGGVMTQNWADYMTLAIIQRLQQTTQIVASPAIAETLSAAYPLTQFTIQDQAAGKYRVTWTVRITTPATVSSSIAVVVSYTRNGVSCTQTSAAVTSNATNLPGSGTFNLRNDGGSPISLSATYASSGVTAAVYELDGTCEFVAS